ncbi:MAG: hypothetical protein J5748_00370 [Bacteroidales bacterium]|nr:hypothetical protein [Bacteroidales bacterium]
MLVNRINQKNERKLTALMVMSSIEQFARDIDDLEPSLAHKDSVATWLVNIPHDDVAKLGDDLLIDAYSDVINLPVISHDKTAEKIFSGNIDTWKNIGNFQFIDNVGQCFSLIDMIEEYYNGSVDAITKINDAVYSHPDHYPGVSWIEKLLSEKEMISKLKNIHTMRGWLSYAAAYIRQENRKNMSLIGIPEAEIMEFTDNLGAADQYEEQELNQYDFRKPELDLDSLVVSYSHQVDSALRAK